MAKKLELSGDGAFQYLLSYITRSAKTEMQVRIKLKEKGFSIDDRNFAVNKAIVLNLINDQDYAVNYVEFYGKARGKVRLKRELHDKGVSDKIIDEVLSEKEDEVDNCFAVATKYLKNKKRDEKLKEKLLRHLVSRGFSYSIIKGVLDRLDIRYDETDV